MELLLNKTNVHGIPVYVESWAAALVSNLVSTALMRWEREYEKLPESFYMLICPQVEINARGGLPADIHEYIDAKLTCRQFTGCHKPYFIALFVDKSAEESCLKTQQLLAWSEAYKVNIKEGDVILHFVGCTEELDDEIESEFSEKKKKFQELISTGELMRILE